MCWILCMCVFGRAYPYTVKTIKKPYSFKISCSNMCLAKFQVSLSKWCQKSPPNRPKNAKSTQDFNKNKKKLFQIQICLQSDVFRKSLAKAQLLRPNRVPTLFQTSLECVVECDVGHLFSNVSNTFLKQGSQGNILVGLHHEAKIETENNTLISNDVSYRSLLSIRTHCHVWRTS